MLFKCIGGCFVDYYVRNIYASAICRLVVGCCNRAAARRCHVLLDKIIFVKSFNRLARYYLTTENQMFFITIK